MSNFPKQIICETSMVQDGNMSFKAGPRKEVIDNRTNFLGKHGIAYQEHIAMRCDHGDIITLVSSKHPALGATSNEEQVHSEVLVTREKHLALLLLTADCQAVSFYDPVTQSIALAHISRKTLVEKLAQKTIGFLRDTLGVDPVDLLVHVGPHITKESYAFPLPLTDPSAELLPYTTEKDGFAYIDLTEANKAQLIAGGVRPENISISPVDTGTSKDHYSYFMMRKNNEPGDARMATILMMR